MKKSRFRNVGGSVVTAFRDRIILLLANFCAVLR